MDSTVDVLSKQPWGETRSEVHKGYSYRDRFGFWGKDPIERSFTAQFKLVRDNKNSYWKRADIIRFNSGYHDWQFRQENAWKEWFMKKKDYLESIHNHPRSYFHGKVPMYARLEFGMIISRYKWIKIKDFKIYQDYGSIILMLSGSKAGHMRKYYVKTPYQLVSNYPYDHIIPYWEQTGVTEIPEIGRVQEAMHYSGGDRDQFILNMIASYKDENYPMNREEKYDASTNFRFVRKGEGL